MFRPTPTTLAATSWATRPSQRSGRWAKIPLSDWSVTRILTSDWSRWWRGWARTRRGRCSSSWRAAPGRHCWASRSAAHLYISWSWSLWSSFRCNAGPGSSLLHPELRRGYREVTHSLHLHEPAQTARFQGENVRNVKLSWIKSGSILIVITSSLNFVSGRSSSEEQAFVRHRVRRRLRAQLRIYCSDLWKECKTSEQGEICIVKS